MEPSVDTLMESSVDPVARTSGGVIPISTIYTVLREITWWSAVHLRHHWRALATYAANLRTHFLIEPTFLVSTPSIFS